MNDGQLPASPGKRRRVRNFLAVAAAVVVVGALASTATIALLRNATLSSQVTAADAKAANAQAAAQKDYSARNAALNRKSQTIAAEAGELKANAIRADGLYVVGHDIKSGTWHTVGDGHLSGGLCRFAVIGSAKLASNPPGPLYFDGPWTVDLSGVYGFIISGPCTWIREP